MMVESSTWHREFGISKMIMTTTNINHVCLYKTCVYHFIPESTKWGLLVPDWYNQRNIATGLTYMSILTVQNITTYLQHLQSTNTLRYHI